MLTLRSMAVVEAMLAAVLLVGAASSSQDSLGRAASVVREQVALPGTALSGMDDGQAGWLAGRVDRLAREQGRGESGVAAFLASFRTLRRTGAVGRQAVCPGNRTVQEVASKMGELMARQRELKRCGRSAQLAECLSGLSAARDAGASEAQVQQAARAAVEQNQLSVSTEAEGRELQAELDELSAALVAGVMSVRSCSL